MSNSESDDEAYDNFQTNTGGNSFLFDPASIAHVSATAEATPTHRTRGRRNRPLFSSGASRGSRSAATTQLASDVGSTVVRAHIPFLKSFTFFDPKIYCRKAEGDDAGGEQVDEIDESANEDSRLNTTNENNNNDDNEEDDITVEVDSLQHWDIQLQDPPPIDPHKKKSLLDKLQQSKLGSKLNLHRKPHITITNFDGLLEYSSVQSGDSLLSINQQEIDPELTSAQQARQFMDECIEREGVLNIVTENTSGDDIFIHVTVIKPKRDMTYDELGLVVWNWPYLCVRQINEGSIFEHTPVREMDQIAAVNDIWL